MLQLTQKLKSGEMQVQDVPPPVAGRGMVVVRNHFSLISAGTEGAMVTTARKGLIGKARERPEQARQVLDVLQKQGPVQTYRAVMKRLDAYSPLGYSSAGEVVEVGEGVAGFQAGDLAACAGVGYANHAEIVAVPENLCVKLDPQADLADACYNTLGAIALQGVRQADLRLGETCAVIGLGLLGQLTCQILGASGVRTIGVDVAPDAVETAAALGVELALIRDEADGAQVAKLTGGLGVDAVIITAAADSTDPINLAGELARKRGRVVVVGDVPTGFDRNPHYYPKELELRMSCSYGPGRYDPAYEEKGLDYPPAYVRWTENRNMRAFQALIHDGKIDVSALTTHAFPFAEAPRAYDMIVGRTERHLGVVLRYDVDRPYGHEKIPTRTTAAPAGRVGISFIGAGSYAQGNLLPHLPGGRNDVVLRGVMARSGTTSKRVAERFDFAFCTSRKEDLLDDLETNTVFVATRHDSHAKYVLEALEANKNVFVEKPLCLTRGQLEAITAQAVEREDSSPLLMVGFNRRFAPLGQLLRDAVIGPGPASMLYRVNAGAVPADHWTQDPERGGGRIVGEVCHFIDFLTYVCGALPVRVAATALPDPDGLNDCVSINLEFADGSIGSVAYFTNGARSLAKEYIEISCGGKTGILRDFRQLDVLGEKRLIRKKLVSQDKGQRTMVSRFIESVREGGPSPVPLRDALTVTRATFAVLEALRTREVVPIG